MWRLLPLETRRLFRERIGWVVLLVMTLACTIAVIQGRAAMAQLEQGRAAAIAAQADTEQTILKQIAAATSETASILPRRVSLPILAPLPPLADFSAGRSGFEDYSTAARMGLREDGLFKRTRLDNPELLARGHVDLGFIAVVVMPLLLIALGYGVFAADRDSGIAKITLTQSRSPLPLLIARSAPRLVLVLLPLAVAAFLLLLTGPLIEGRSEAAAIWFVLTGLLALFWWSVILLANSFRITAESAALTLVSVWAAFTLILPPLIAAAAQAANPAPSRFEQIATSRAAEILATSDFENDHPELTDAAAERRRQAQRAILIDRDIEAAVAPITLGFEEQRTEQRALANMLAFLSPALVAGDAKAAIAGTDGATWLDFRRAAGAYLKNAKEALGTLLIEERPMTSEAYRDLPRFEWTPPRHKPFAAIIYLLSFTVLIGGFAVWRFRQVQLA